MKQTERIAEYPITEWHGARIKVTVECPWLNNTMSTQMYISTHELEILKNIRPREDMELLLDRKPEHARYALIQYERDFKIALNLIDQISATISNQLIRVIMEKK